MQQLWVNQADITQIARHDVDLLPLGADQARLAVKQFALTANNVTYAAAGFVLDYWAFFPSGAEGQGIVPVWGFAEVVESNSAALEVGTRLYGYLPMAQQFDITPEALKTGGVRDAAPHRAHLSPIYNQYLPTRSSDPAAEGIRSLLQPLLITSFLLSDWLEDNSFYGAEQVIISSASSKTGLGLAKFLAQSENKGVTIVGLTSEGNRGFVEALGAFDQVLSYDEIARIDQRPSVYVDMSGNSTFKATLHDHLADVLRHSCAVGTSHWDKFQPKQPLAGPKPAFFFAPAQIEKRRTDWGPGVIDQKIAAAWQTVAADAGGWLSIVYHQGLDAAIPVFEALAQGKASPEDGHVILLE